MDWNWWAELFWATLYGMEWPQVTDALIVAAIWLQVHLLRQQIRPEGWTYSYVEFGAQGTTEEGLLFFFFGNGAPVALYLSVLHLQFMTSEGWGETIPIGVRTLIKPYDMQPVWLKGEHFPRVEGSADVPFRIRAEVFRGGKKSETSWTRLLVEVRYPPKSFHKLRNLGPINFHSRRIALKQWWNDSVIKRKLTFWKH